MHKQIASVGSFQDISANRTFVGSKTSNCHSPLVVHGFWSAMSFETGPCTNLPSRIAKSIPHQTSATPRHNTKVHSTLRLRCPLRVDAWPRPLRTSKAHPLRPSRNEPLLRAQRMRWHIHGMPPRRKPHV